MIKINLSTILGKKRWTQADLARRTGIRPTTISEYYHELVDRVNLDYINIMCNVLECQLDEILEYIPDNIKNVKDIRE